jgi:hypothetical protein
MGSARFKVLAIVASVFFLLTGISYAAPLKPCECKNIKDLEKSIKEDEYLQKRYAEKAAEYLGQIDEYKSIGRIPPSLITRQVNEYATWATVTLPAEFQKAMGYKQPVFKITPDPKKPNTTDKKKLDAYKKAAACQEIYDSAVTHENYHNQATKDIASGKKKLSSAVDLAKEEVAAYEAGLQVLRNTLDNLRKKCGAWLCRCNQQRYASAGECAAKCPPARLGKCHAPTCVQLDPKTGKWKPGKGRAY